MPIKGEWLRLDQGTKAQEFAIRVSAEKYGFKDLRSFKAYMRVNEWDYYDVIKVSCRD